MSLTAGTRLGPYEIVSRLGTGGMGEVYRARDTTLHRDVALKILPEAFASDPDRLMRFTREAQTLASLNHPNIAAIYGIEDRAIVMELVEGRDLSDVIAAGSEDPALRSTDGAPGLQTRGIPLDEAIAIARQIAGALEAAHEAGIIHRDLKPANIRIRADGVVKVLDFGLAKAIAVSEDPALHPDGGPGLQARADAPTVTSPALTQMGIVLGTAAYMAPEQARGRPVDHRADIWAFGAVLAEMLTGQHAFKGEDITDTLAAVVKSPPRLDGLPQDTPSAIRRLLRRCLEKDPRRRLSSIADARLELEDAEAPADPDLTASAAPLLKPSLVARFWPAIVGILATLVTLAVVAVVASWRQPPAADLVTRTTLLIPPDTRMSPDASQAAISPDGTMVTMVVTNADGVFELWLRSLDSPTPRHLDVGPVNGAFWKPDSSRIGFFTMDGKLKTVSVDGGRAEELCDTPNPRGGTWSVSDVIVFAPDGSGPLYRVPAGGGPCEPLTTVDASRRQEGHRFPVMLPDGERFFYAATPGLRGKFDAFVGSLSGDTATFVGSFESVPVYAEPGWLLYARQGGLVAQAFDATTLTLGETVITLDDEPAIEWNPNVSLTAAPVVSVSSTGSLVYTSAPSIGTTAVWHDAAGRPTGTFELPAGHYDKVAVAPDGVHAVFVRSMSASDATLWLANLSTGHVSPLRTGPGRNQAPVWSPDSAQVAFSSDRDGPQDIYAIGIDDAAQERLLHRANITFRTPSAWSGGPIDRQWIVLTQQDPDVNLWLLSPTSGEIRPFLTRPFPEAAGVLDPTGRWMAHISLESGRPEVNIQSFPEPGQKVPVTRQGGTLPHWLPDGRLLFRAAATRSIWEVPLGTGATPQPGEPRQLATFPEGTLWIEPLPDGRFLSIVRDSTDGTVVTLLQHWRTALRAGQR